MKISLQTFLGEFPIVHQTRLKDDAAAIAKNVNIESGVLKPFFNIEYYQTLPALSGNKETKSFHKYRVIDSEYWLQFSDYVNVIRSPIKADNYARVYWSGDSMRSSNGEVLYSYIPIINNGTAPYPIQSIPLGIPAPLSAPTVINATEITDDTISDESRIYVYTYVNEIGEESAPSPASAIITVPYANSVVEIGSMLTDDSILGLNITKKRIYRSLSTSTGIATLYYVSEIDVSETTFTDNYAGTSLGEECPSINWDQPRLGMKGLGLTAYGMAYGFYEKIVCLSYPFYIFAWPRDYELTTQYEIVAIGHYESNIIVATTGNPVMITGIDPATGLSMSELPLNEACVSKRSLVSLGYGVIYASPNGLVLATASGAKLVTDNLFGKDQWNNLNPSSIHAVEHRGEYLFFWKNNKGEKGAYIFDPKDTGKGIIQLDIYSDYAYRDIKTDTLYLLDLNNKINKFNVDDNFDRETYTWRSKIFTMPNVNGQKFLSGQLLADTYNNTVIKLYADGELFYAFECLGDRPFRIPNHSGRRTWQIEIISSDVVRSIHIAGTMQELILNAS